MSVRVGLWSVCNGWLLVDGARWYGVWVGGLLVVVGWGGRGWVLCRLGVRASLWVVWVLRVCAVWPLRFLTGCGAGVRVGGDRMSPRVGLWSVRQHRDSPKKRLHLRAFLASLVGKQIKAIQ